jgi:hypothetical protein
MKSGKFNFSEKTGPLQTYNGTALPFCHNRLDTAFQQQLRKLNIMQDSFFLPALARFITLLHQPHV